MTDSQEWKRNILGGVKRGAMPIMTHPGIEMIGATVQKAAMDGEVQAEAVQALSRRFPVIASTLMMDLSVEAEAFGAIIQFPEHDVPVIISRMVEHEKDIRELPIPSLQSGRIPQYLKAAEISAMKITDRPVFASCIGPFSLAGRLFGMTEIMMAVMLEPQIIHLLLEKCTTFLTAYIHAYRQRGSGGLIMAEPAAGMLSPEMCHEFSSQYIGNIVSEVQDDHFLIILHNCGNTNKLLASMQSTGAAGFHFGKPCDLINALHFIDPDRLVMGNLDPVEVFKLAAPTAVREATLNVLDKTTKYNNYIISSGCDIPPHTPLENLETFFETLELYNHSHQV